MRSVKINQSYSSDMEMVNIKLDGGIVPTLGSQYAAAYDLYCPSDYVLCQGRQVVDLGFFLELPLYWRANIRPRCGFSAKGMEVRRYTYFSDDTSDVKTVRIDADVLLGLIDCDYRGHVGVLLKVNTLDVGIGVLTDYKSKEVTDIRYVIPRGMRLAQMEICKGEETVLVLVDELNMSIDRGGGYGHTGSL